MHLRPPKPAPGRAAATACVMTASFLMAMASFATADGTCQSDLGELGPASVVDGTLDTYRESDWYDLFAGQALVLLQPGVEASALHVHDVLGMDADLYIWDIPCENVLCSSIAASGQPDACIAETPDPLGWKWRMHVEVRWYSDGGNGHIPYTLSVTETAS